MLIRLYTTAGCHLCEQAQELLSDACQHQNIQINAIEIGENDALIAEFGVHIPVLEFPDNSRLYWPFTLTDLMKKL